MIPPIPLPQCDRAELLDEGAGSFAEVRRSLHDIRRINRWLGGTQLLCNVVLALLARRNLKRATVLDIGTGGADIPLHLIAAGKKHGIEISVLALDLSGRHLRVARENMVHAGGASIQLLRADAFALPLRDGAVDVVMASLFLHHFRAPQIQALLKEWQRVARIGFVAADIERDAVPLWFFRLVRPVFARSYLTRFDGEASIRRAYTAAEMQQITGECAKVRQHFPYRISVVGEQ
ncbi:MAG TPA: methyltransferase domain-containing protein [Abditibacteriaceae bacterium]|jgi:ubiquinone/menaquinone biosynthesis C-methylase UbiE